MIGYSKVINYQLKMSHISFEFFRYNMVDLMILYLKNKSNTHKLIHELNIHIPDGLRKNKKILKKYKMIGIHYLINCFDNDLSICQQKDIYKSMCILEYFVNHLEAQQKFDYTKFDDEFESCFIKFKNMFKFRKIDF